MILSLTIHCPSRRITFILLDFNNFSNKKIIKKEKASSYVKLF